MTIRVQRRGEDSLYEATDSDWPGYYGYGETPQDAKNDLRCNLEDIPAPPPLPTDSTELLDTSARPNDRDPSPEWRAEVDGFLRHVRREHLLNLRISLRAWINSLHSDKQKFDEDYLEFSELARAFQAIEDACDPRIVIASLRRKRLHFGKLWRSPYSRSALERTRPLTPPLPYGTDTHPLEWFWWQLCGTLLDDTPLMSLQEAYELPRARWQAAQQTDKDCAEIINHLREALRLYRKILERDGGFDITPPMDEIEEGLRVSRPHEWPDNYIQKALEVMECYIPVAGGDNPIDGLPDAVRPQDISTRGADRLSGTLAATLFRVLDEATTVPLSEYHHYVGAWLRCVDFRISDGNVSNMLAGWIKKRRESSSPKR